MTKTPDSGLIALVCYLPEPLNTTLTTFRDVLKSSYSAVPHITILPPRPIRVAPDNIERHIEAALAPHREFAVELTALLSFPATNVLYLAVETGGSDLLKQLHVALNTGELSYREAYEFTPHVTVAGPFDSDALPQLLQQANELWNASKSVRSFAVRELVLLWSDSDGNRWEPLRTFTLKSGTREFLATVGNRT
jgi:2'-5' RNA ligase